MTILEIIHEKLHHQYGGFSSFTSYFGTSQIEVFRGKGLAKATLSNFTFMLPCIVIDFFLNNQPDALIIQFYSVVKLYMFRASSLPIIRSFLLHIRHW